MTHIATHIAVVDGQLTTTTQDIAEVFGKRHDDVLRVTRKRMSESGEWRLRNFAETVIERPNPSGGAPIQSPVIRLTKKGFVFVVQKFTGAKAVKFQLDYIDEFERMEAALRAPAKPASLGGGLKAAIAEAVREAVANQPARLPPPAPAPDGDRPKFTLLNRRWIVYFDENGIECAKQIPSEAGVFTPDDIIAYVSAPGGFPVKQMHKLLAAVTSRLTTIMNTNYQGSAA